ncbi:MAG: DinB family protein [Fluviicola sp.]
MNFTAAIRQEFELRVFQESYPRIEKCLNTISEDQIWVAPNENLVSIGCLIKHLLGNAQQWVYSGVLGNSFDRDRNFEFVSEPNLGKTDLLELMEDAKTKITKAFESLNVDQLQRNFVIQGFETTGISAVIHVIEHFSYHTGQISLLTKMFQNVDLEYYANHNLDV